MTMSKGLTYAQLVTRYHEKVAVSTRTFCDYGQILSVRASIYRLGSEHAPPKQFLRSISMMAHVPQNEDLS